MCTNHGCVLRIAGARARAASAVASSRDRRSVYAIDCRKIAYGAIGHPGRLPVSDRVALGGIAYVLRKGVVWRNVPAQGRGLFGRDSLATPTGLDRGWRLSPPE